MEPDTTQRDLSHVEPKPFYHVRDIARGEALVGDAVIGRSACLTGLVTRRNKHKTTLFLDLADGMGTIQALLPRGQDEALWEGRDWFPGAFAHRDQGVVDRSHAPATLLVGSRY